MATAARAMPPSGPGNRPANHPLIGPSGTVANAIKLTSAPATWADMP